jgi:hypothetical protein
VCDVVLTEREREQGGNKKDSERTHQRERERDGNTRKHNIKYLFMISWASLFAPTACN